MECATSKIKDSSLGYYFELSIENVFFFLQDNISQRILLAPFLSLPPFHLASYMYPH